MSFLDHLAELRTRLIHAVIAIFDRVPRLPDLRRAGFWHIGCSYNKTSAARVFSYIHGASGPVFHLHEGVFYYRNFYYSSLCPVSTVAIYKSGSLC